MLVLSQSEQNKLAPPGLQVSQEWTEPVYSADMADTVEELVVSVLSALLAAHISKALQELQSSVKAFLPLVLEVVVVEQLRAD